MYESVTQRSGVYLKFMIMYYSEGVCISIQVRMYVGIKSVEIEK